MLRLEISKGFLVTILVIFLLAAISSPAYYFLKYKPDQTAKTTAQKTADEAEFKLVSDSFTTQNPDMVKVLQAASQTKTYVFVWQDKQNTHISALIGGIWVNLADQPIKN